MANQMPLEKLRGRGGKTGKLDCMLSLNASSDVKQTLEVNLGPFGLNIYASPLMDMNDKANRSGKGNAGGTEKQQSRWRNGFGSFVLGSSNGNAKEGDGDEEGEDVATGSKKPSKPSKPGTKKKKQKKKSSMLTSSSLVYILYLSGEDMDDEQRHLLCEEALEATNAGKVVLIMYETDVNHGATVDINLDFDIDLSVLKSRTPEALRFLFDECDPIPLYRMEPFSSMMTEAVLGHLNLLDRDDENRGYSSLDSSGVNDHDYEGELEPHTKYDTVPRLDPTSIPEVHDDEYAAIHLRLCEDLRGAIVKVFKMTKAEVPAPVGICGLPGTGKSWLACRIANDGKVQRHFRDGVYWIDAKDLSLEDVERKLLRQLLDAQVMVETSIEEPSTVGQGTNEDEDEDEDVHENNNESPEITDNRVVHVAQDDGNKVQEPWNEEPETEDVDDLETLASKQETDQSGDEMGNEETFSQERGRNVEDTKPADTYLFGFLGKRFGGKYLIQLPGTNRHESEAMNKENEQQGNSRNSKGFKSRSKTTTAPKPRQSLIQAALKRRRCLIVLDDVEDERVVEGIVKLAYGLAGDRRVSLNFSVAAQSRILFTTQNIATCPSGTDVYRLDRVKSRVGLAKLLMSNSQCHSNLHILRHRTTLFKSRLLHTDSYETKLREAVTQVEDSTGAHCMTLAACSGIADSLGGNWLLVADRLKRDGSKAILNSVSGGGLRERLLSSISKLDQAIMPYFFDLAVFTQGRLVSFREIEVIWKRYSEHHNLSQQQQRHSRVSGNRSRISGRESYRDPPGSKSYEEVLTELLLRSYVQEFDVHKHPVDTILGDSNTRELHVDRRLFRLHPLLHELVSNPIYREHMGQPTCETLHELLVDGITSLSENHSPLRMSLSNFRYLHQMLSYHMVMAGQRDRLARDVLLRYDWIASKVARVRENGLSSVLDDIDLVLQTGPIIQELEWLGSALRHAAQNVAENPKCLPEQLWSRLAWKHLLQTSQHGPYYDALQRFLETLNKERLKEEGLHSLYPLLRPADSPRVLALKRHSSQIRGLTILNLTTNLPNDEEDPDRSFPMVVCTVSVDSQLRWCEINTGKLLRTTRLERRSVAWSIDACQYQDGSRVVAVGMSRGTVQLFCFDTGRLLREFTSDREEVVTVAVQELALDGTRVVLGGMRENHIFIWDAKSGKVLKKLKEPCSKAIFLDSRITTPLSQDLASSARFDKDSNRLRRILSTDGYQKLSIWNYDSGKRLHHIKTLDASGGNGTVTAIDACHVGINRSVFACVNSYNHVTMWDLDTAETLHRIISTDYAVTSLALGYVHSSVKDENILLLCFGTSQGKLSMWDLSSTLRNVDNEEEAEDMLICDISKAHEDSLTHVAIGQGQAQRKTYERHSFGLERCFIITAGRDDRIFTWGLDNAIREKTGKKIREEQQKVLDQERRKSVRIETNPTDLYEAHDGFVNSLDMCLNETTGRSCILSASQDNTVKIWDVATGVQINEFNGHHGSVISIDSGRLFDGTQVVATGSEDMNVMLWNLHSGELISTLAHPDKIWCVKFISMNDGRYILATACLDANVRLFNTADNSLIFTFSGHNAMALCVDATVLNHGRQVFVSGSADRTLRVWDPLESEEIHILFGHQRDVMCVTTYEDLAFSGSWQGPIRIWNLEQGSSVRVLRGHSDQVRDLCIIPVTVDMPLLVSSSYDQTIKVWNFKASCDMAGSISSIGTFDHPKCSGSTLCLAWNYEPGSIGDSPSQRKATKRNHGDANDDGPHDKRTRRGRIILAVGYQNGGIAQFTWKKPPRTSQETSLIAQYILNETAPPLST